MTSFDHTLPKTLLLLNLCSKGQLAAGSQWNADLKSWTKSSADFSYVLTKVAYLRNSSYLPLCYFPL